MAYPMPTSAQTNIDPALRQNSLTSPPHARESYQQNGASQSQSQSQPQPQPQSQPPLAQAQVQGQTQTQTHGQGQGLGQAQAQGQAQGHPPCMPTSASSYPQPGPPPATPIYYDNPNAQNSQVQDSPADAEDSPANPNDPNDLKRPRACEACRQLKVKCEPDDNSPTGSCKRCAKANRQCVVTAPSRKRQKKTDSRVAELEKKIDALTATLAARGGDADGLDHPLQHHPQHPGGPPQGVAPSHPLPPPQQHPTPTYSAHWSGGAPPPPPPPPTIQASPQRDRQLGVKRKMSDRPGADYFGGELHKATAIQNSYQPTMPQPPQFTASYIPQPPRIKVDDDDIVFDPIVHGTMDAITVRKCWDRYTNDMCYHLPLVVFPPGTRWEDLRKTKPILFLSIIAVASGTIRPELQGRFLTEVTKLLADRVVYRGEKSLELVQTIQCMTTFYQPPEKYEELNFNQLIHIAAVMALDIGLGKRFKKGNVALWRSYTEQKRALPDPNSAETRRCWLGCYFMCSNSAMSLRRPLLIRWSPYADECIDILNSAPDAAPTDKWLCLIVRGQHIAEIIGLEFSMDDPASQLSLTDHKTQYHLKAFERQLSEWHESATPEMQKKPTLKHMYGIINLYMHEIAMHHNHNIDDFKPPFHATPIEGPPDPDFVTPAHIESLTTCMNSVHTVFDAFLSMDVNLSRALPTLFFVRNSYAAVALIKMYTAVSAKGSKFGSIIKNDDLKVDYYLERMIAKLTETAQDGMCKVAWKFSMIFDMLKQWHVRRTDPDFKEGSNPVSRQRTPLNGPPYCKQMMGDRKGSLMAVPQHQDPNTIGWTHPSQQRNGLQMLSDAAMGPVQGQPQLPPPGHNWVGQGPAQLSGLTPMNPEMDPNLMYAPAGMNPEHMGMEPLDLMAYGFGDEFMAMGFGMGIEQGGWAF